MGKRNKFGQMPNKLKQLNQTVMSHSLLLLTLSLCYTNTVYASNEYNDCIIKVSQTGDDSLTLGEIRKLCAQQKETQTLEDNSVKQPTAKTGLISQRIEAERETEFERFVISPHKPNYILPVYSTSGINKAPYELTANGYEENLEDVESMFQVSIKAPLTQNGVFHDEDGIYLGFTLQAWWQIYANGISKPFRELNYQPEIFYLSPLDWKPLGWDTAVIVGAEHQSNGQTIILSRSWNRIYTSFLFEKDDFAYFIRPWYRIPEDEKQTIASPDGDDNPDILDYYGHFDFGVIYKTTDYEFNLLGKQNFSTNKGSVELGMTFPLLPKIRGFVKVFHGYGESLIDYNYSQTRVGIGFSLSDFL